MKIRRNDPCLCGSGKKYKRCCLSSSDQRGFRSVPPEILLETERRFQEHQRREHERRQRYGDVRPIIHLNFQDQKFVAVGNELHYSPNWKTFHDFLLTYMGSVLGSDWGNAELAKPLIERHQILQWWDHVCRFQQKHAQDQRGEVHEAIPDGITAAYLYLAYDLYLLRDHSKLQAEVVRRLKHPDQFQGARYELLVAAAMIRAGFDIAYENEGDVTSTHPEFSAIHKATGQRLAIEAKSRRRPGILGHPGKRQDLSELKANVHRLINAALKKKVNDPYAIFIDVNLPPEFGDLQNRPWIKEIQGNLTHIANEYEGKSPFDFVFFTNTPHAYREEDIPDPGRYMYVARAVDSVVVKRYPGLCNEIERSILQYGHVPSEFPEQ